MELGVQEAYVPHLDLSLKPGDTIMIIKKRPFSRDAVPHPDGWIMPRLTIKRLCLCVKGAKCLQCDSKVFIIDRDGTVICLSRAVVEIKILSKEIEKINKCVVV